MIFIIMELTIKDIYYRQFGTYPSFIERISEGGSNRKYFRIGSVDNKTVIATIGKSYKENNAFIELANHFYAHNINVPKIIGHNESKSVYIQEDLGDTSLFSILGTDVAPNLIAKTISALARLQTVPRIDYSICYPEAKFNRKLIMWDLNYFKYCFLKIAVEDFNESDLEVDFNRIADNLLSTPKKLWGFMYRDCQSRNVIIKDNRPYWIDFQGGRYGPCIYDIVSFLWQAKANFSDSFRDKMIDLYIEEFSKYRDADYTGMRTLIPVFVLFRTLQVLGAYGFRGLMQHKAHFIQSIPLAISNLAKLLKQGIIDEYPCLKSAINTIVESNRFKKDESSKLTVEVFSFSYKKGYPDDFSGNGGGFMFDCRAMHNPGRYTEYKSLSGLDAPVINFLEERGEIQVFLENAWSLTDPAIERYLQRGFTNIQIGFGCTGGQHRSVYSAEHTAKHIAKKYPDAIVKLTHREQGITKLFNHTNTL